MPTTPPRHSDAAEQILRALDHDLRNPVANILGFVDLLRDTPDGVLNAEQLELCSRIEDNCQTLLEMLRGLTTLARQRQQP